MWRRQARKLVRGVIARLQDPGCLWSHRNGASSSGNVEVAVLGRRCLIPLPCCKMQATLWVDAVEQKLGPLMRCRLRKAYLERRLRDAAALAEFDEADPAPLLAAAPPPVGGPIRSATTVMDDADTLIKNVDSITRGKIEALVDQYAAIGTKINAVLDLLKLNASGIKVGAKR